MVLKILYISALPRDQKPIPVEKEYLAIDDAIKKSDYKNQFELSHSPSISLEKFQSVIQKGEPNVLHFSGHAFGNLRFQGQQDESQLVPKEPLANAFSLLKVGLKLVILSACYVEEQARMVSHYVDRVIGIEGDIDGNQAILFFQALYESIGNGKSSVEEAFEIAKNQISLNLKEGERVPSFVLLRNPANPSPLFLIDTPRKQLEEYLHYIVSETSPLVETTDSGLVDQPTYIENRRGTHILFVGWNAEDTKLEKGKLEYFSEKKGKKIEEEIEIMDALDIIDKFLSSDYDDRYHLIIGAPFGVGKSSFIRKIAHDQAQIRLRAEDDNTNYIPILISDTNTMDNFYHGKGIEEFIDTVAAPYDNNKNILIIFDGIDEHNDGIKSLLKRVRSERFTRYVHRKIILITRLDPEFPKEYGAKGTDKYLRLLPFTVPQVEEFFKNLQTDLTYQKALGLGVSDEEIRKPLLALILSGVYKSNLQDLLRLKEETLTSDEYRAFIYLNFIHRLIKAKTAGRSLELKKYREEKMALRKIALLIKLFRENLTENIIINKPFPEFFELETDDPISRLKEILHDYFDIPLLDESSGERKILFLHSTFKEYLMAENYIEILLVSKDDDTLSSWMNVTKPTEESMQFLRGLIGLIKKKDQNEAIGKWIERSSDNQGSLFNSFKYGNWINKPLADLLRNSSDVVKDDTVSLLIRDKPDENKAKERLRFVKSGMTDTGGTEGSFPKYRNYSINEYQNLWIRRWIALYVMTVIDPTGCWNLIDDKTKIERLIIQTDNIIPGYMKVFAYADLSKLFLRAAKLSRANLYMTKLVGTDLTGAYLYKANLVEAHLENALLGGANLTEANATGTHLDDAHCEGTIFYRANLTNAFLVNTHLNGSHMNNAIFNGAKMKEAKMSAATMYHASFRRSDLTKADLRNSNIRGCDFEGATVTGVQIMGSNMEGTYLTPEQREKLARSESAIRS